MEDPSSTWSAEFLEMRRKHIREHGGLCLDTMAIENACGKCGQMVAGSGLGVAAARWFGSLKELVDEAAKLCTKMAKKEKAVPCRACGGSAGVVSARYHAFHGGLGKDLVVHLRPGKGRWRQPVVELLLWDPAGGTSPARDLAEEDEARLVHEAALREAWASFELGDARRGVDRVAGVFEAGTAEPLLLRFVPQLMAGRYMALSQAIAERHRQLVPDDAEGHYWYGEALLTRINNRLEPLERLGEARAALEEALSRKDEHLPAALALALALRMEKRYREARSVYEILLERQPGCAEAHFNLATMSLEDEPQLALEHFEAGERLEPEDPDHPVGAARALVKLGRNDEARRALERAKELTDEHPHFAELRKALK